MKICLLSVMLVFSLILYGQEENIDSSELEEVTVKAFEQNRRRGLSSVNVRIIEFNNADRSNKTSLVNGFNTVPGVRMEERSPGSYRINIRGSSLRSPFGVRNVKVYWNGIPVTDAGGNTYFNQFAWNNFSHIEIYKGPASSLYGAGTGGLLLLENFDRWKPGISLEYVGGSYNLHNAFISIRTGKTDNKTQWTFAHNESDGYRQQTKMRRDNFSFISKIKASEKQQLTASLLFTDMYYQTPGALTLAEFNTDPKAARPAAAGFPSAVNAKAAIYQKNILAGITNEQVITGKLKNTTTLYAAYAHIKNPTFRNYERRSEPQFGARSFFSWNKDFVHSSFDKNSLQLIAGAEWQQGYFNTRVSENRNGQPDTLLTNDDIQNRIHFYFFQGEYIIRNEWFFTGGVSLNKNKVKIERVNQYPVQTKSRTYRNELAPRISVMKKFEDLLSLKFSLSRGFSPPTIAEVLPSTGVISTNLEAEYGWNYETGISVNAFKRLRVELTGYLFNLNDALVQGRDSSGGDFFINVGHIRQKGLELDLDYTYPFSRGPLNYFIIDLAYGFQHYRYIYYRKNSDNFDGKMVPSVPAHSISALLDLQLKNGLYSNATLYAASKIYLNDANTAVADNYQLLGWRLGWRKTWGKEYRFNIYAGADNLLDQKYSLGNDINAAGGRYYNAAPGRNYYVGIGVQFLK